MENKSNQIFGQDGNDSEFQYHSDSYASKGYSSDTPPIQPNRPNQVGFSDEYLASLQYNQKKFDLPWYDTDLGFILIIGVGLGAMVVFLCLCSVVMALV